MMLFLAYVVFYYGSGTCVSIYCIYVVVFPKTSYSMLYNLVHVVLSIIIVLYHTYGSGTCVSIYCIYVVVFPKTSYSVCYKICPIYM